MRVIACEQRSAEWWEEKFGRPSPSNFDRILTPTGKPSSQAMDYACQLVAERLAPPMPTYFIKEYESLAMQRGTASEPEARAWFALETGLEVKQVGLVISDCERYCGSPDGLLGDDSGLELKCPLPHTHIRYLLDATVPPKYLPQVHGYMVVTGRRQWHFQSYCAGFPPLLVQVGWNEYTDKLAAALEEFYTLYQSLLARIEAGREAEVRRVVPAVDPETVDTIW